MSSLANNKKWSTQNEIYHEIQKYDSHSVIYFIIILKLGKHPKCNMRTDYLYACMSEICDVLFYSLRSKNKKIAKKNRWLIILCTFVWCAWTNIEVFAFFYCLFVFLRRILRIMIVIRFSLDVLSWLRSSVSPFCSGFSRKPNNSIKLWWW